MFGIFGPFILVFTVVLAGFLIPGYSQINNAVSHIGHLINNKYYGLITILFCLFSLSLMIFSYYTYKHSYKYEILNKLQSLCLFIVGILCFIENVSPMDNYKAPTSILGYFHVSSICFASPLIVFIIYSTYIENKKNKIGLFSLIICLFLLIIGSITGIYYIIGMPDGFGLIERITIGLFLLWIVVISFSYKKKINNIYY